MQEILYGKRPVYETLRTQRRTIYELWFRESLQFRADVHDIRHMADIRGIPIRMASAARLNSLLGHVNHQGMAARVSAYPYEPLDTALQCVRSSPSSVLLLVLDHLQDPQNVGSIFRTAEAVGVGGVIIPKDRAVGVTPAVVRASAGASEHLRVIRVVNLVRVMREFHAEGVRWIGLDCGPTAVPYTQIDYGGPLGLVIGSEGQGLKRLVREACDALAAIPMRGTVASLNAGVAAAVALYEALRQRG